MIDLLPFIKYLFRFMSFDYLGGIVVCLLVFAVFGMIFGLVGRRRYINV